MKITLPSGKIITASAGLSILESLNQAEVYLTASCSGKGTCGKCRIIIKDGKTKSLSRMKLTQEEIEKGFALACRTFPEGDISIDIPKESALTVEGRIATGKSKDLQELLRSMNTEIEPITGRLYMKLPPPTLDDNISDLERLKRALSSEGLGCLRVPFRSLKNLADILRAKDWEITLCTIQSEGCEEVTNILSGDRTTPRYGVAIDIGTTTLVVYLIDLTNGSLIDIASTYNSQIKFGDDVITRIVYATEQNELAAMQNTVISDINMMISLITQKHKINMDTVDSIVIAGNPTMTHLFFGLNPAAIREEPYILTANSFPLSFAGELGINVRPDTPLYSLPSVASYVGGDIVSGVLASGLHKKEELSFFMDIGTNGEMVLGNSELLVTAACSAGPCFEGSGIRHGMRATEGAIEDVKINRSSLKPEIKVIGGVSPMGICGSGMIDAISEMFLAGILDSKGALRKEASDRVREGADGLEFLIHSEGGKEITLTTPDIENIIRAKAAIYAAFTTMIKEVGFTFDDISRVYIAGGFGQFLDIEKAVILGMIPDIPREKFIFLGNSSIKGAYLCTLSQKMRAEAEEIAKRMTYLELSVSRSFMDEFMSGLFIPHTEMNNFPSVKALMES
ncbi:MAG: DUF4445 domain-containing protein [Nitrospirae bacterium]|nr:DUF4445 domain-containing protein [Nitrospirota bacterium]